MNSAKKSKIFSVISCIFFIGLLSTGILYYSKESSAGVINGIKFCAYVLVPSLFPFMVLSSFVTESGISVFCSRFLEGFMRTFFGLPGVCGTAFFLCLIGGYPIGAKSISALYRQQLITHAQAKKMTYFAVGAGPGFLVTFIGAGLYNNKMIGFFLLISQTVSVIIIGILCKLIYKEKAHINTPAGSVTYQPVPVTSALVTGSFQGTTGIISMCGMVVLFSAFTSIIDAFFSGNETAHLLVMSLLEVTAACSEFAYSMPVEYVAFLVGWGGLCVHFQVFSFLGEIQMSKAVFLLFRLLQGLLTAGITHLLLLVFPAVTQVFSTAQSVTPQTNYGGIGGSIGLVFTAICFLYTLSVYVTNKPKQQK